MLVMAALATWAVTAALLKDRTHTQAPPPATPDRLRRKTPGMTPLTVPEIRRVLAAAFQRPAPARPRHALAELATPSPRPLVLVPPAHPRALQAGSPRTTGKIDARGRPGEPGLRVPASSPSRA